MDAMLMPVCSEEVHEATKADPERWLGLAFVGVWHGRSRDICLRDCPCRSTLGKPTRVEIRVEKEDAL